MTREQARDILAAYRSGRDETEPLVMTALALAREDPELREWLEQQQQFDSAVRKKLRQVAAPPDLLSRIQAGVARRSAPRQRNLQLLAAGFALLGLLASVWLLLSREPAANSLASCRREMARFLETFPRLDFHSEDPAEMRDWLLKQHQLASLNLPAGLERFPGIGCRTIAWQDKQLALLCFMVDGEVVHLFMLRPDDFPPDSFATAPQFATAGKFNTASWRDQGMAFLILTQGSEAFLRAQL